MHGEIKNIIPVFDGHDLKDGEKRPEKPIETLAVRVVGEIELPAENLHPEERINENENKQQHGDVDEFLEGPRDDANDDFHERERAKELRDPQDSKSSQDTDGSEGADGRFT